MPRNEEKGGSKPKDQTKDIMGPPVGKKIERLRFKIGPKLNQGYHLMLSPSPAGGFVITWMMDGAHADGPPTMSWDEGFAADMFCRNDILGLEISISEIMP